MLVMEYPTVAVSLALGVEAAKLADRAASKKREGNYRPHRHTTGQVDVARRRLEIYGGIGYKRNRYHCQYADL